MDAKTQKEYPGGKRRTYYTVALRTAWRTLQTRRPKEVSMEHVRSHILIPGNELVDWLAAKMDDRIQIKHAEEWINTWLAEQDTEDGYFHPSIT